jgi:Ca2+-binding EF-hand superfamily protein
VEAFFQAIDADDDGALSLDELLQSFAVIAEARPG